MRFDSAPLALRSARTEIVNKPFVIGANKKPRNRGAFFDGASPAYFFAAGALPGLKRNSLNARSATLCHSNWSSRNFFHGS